MSTLNDFSVLIHPGLNGAGPDHWQTHWEQAFPEIVTAVDGFPASRSTAAIRAGASTLRLLAQSLR